MGEQTPVAGEGCPSIPVRWVQLLHSEPGVPLARWAQAALNQLAHEARISPGVYTDNSIGTVLTHALLKSLSTF